MTRALLLAWRMRFTGMVAPGPNPPGRAPGVVVLLVVGQTAEAMILAVPDASLDFSTFAKHGPIVAGRGIAIFAVGVVLGLAMGRVLPAMLPVAHYGLWIVRESAVHLVAILGAFVLADAAVRSRSPR